MDYDDDIADERRDTDASLAVRKPDAAIEGEEALDLYTRQIARNLSRLEEQVLRLRDACAAYEKLLRGIE